MEMMMTGIRATFAMQKSVEGGEGGEKKMSEEGNKKKKKRKKSEINMWK